MAQPSNKCADAVVIAPGCGSVGAVGGIDAMIAEARALGEAWLADECSFCDVTLGMAALSRRLIARERPPALGLPHGRVLVSPVSDDQHSFGSQLVGALLREAGWDVTGDVDSDDHELTDAVASGHYTAICLSVGHDRALDRAGPLVRALRRAARNDIVVALGGPMLNGCPDRARALGGDVHVDDARDLSDALLARVAA